MVRMGDVLTGGAPPRPPPDRPSQGAVPDDLGMHLARQVEELRGERDQARAELAEAQAGRLDDRGRAERAEAERDAERRRADAAEARAEAVAMRMAGMEEEAREARRPWYERVIRTMRGQ